MCISIYPVKLARGYRCRRGVKTKSCDRIHARPRRGLQRRARRPRAFTRYVGRAQEETGGTSPRLSGHGSGQRGETLHGVRVRHLAPVAVHRLPLVLGRADPLEVPVGISTIVWRPRTCWRLVSSMQWPNHVASAGRADWARIKAGRRQRKF